MRQVCLGYAKYVRPPKLWYAVLKDSDLAFEKCRNEEDLHRAEMRMRRKKMHLVSFARALTWSVEKDFTSVEMERYKRQFRKKEVWKICPVRPRRRRLQVIIDPELRRRANRKNRREAPNWSEREFVRLCVGIRRYSAGIDWDAARNDPELPALASASNEFIEETLAVATKNGVLRAILLAENAAIPMAEMSSADPPSSSEDMDPNDPTSAVRRWSDSSGGKGILPISFLLN